MPRSEAIRRFEACTKLTDDQKVFATIGVLIDFAGAAQLCFTKQHKTILITHELSQDVMDKAPGGLLLTTDTLAERSTRDMLEQANTKGLLTGKKFGILAETGNKSRINDVIKPELKKLNVPVGTAGVLTLDPSGDTTAIPGAARQLHRAVERRKHHRAVHVRSGGSLEGVRPEDPQGPG